MRIIFVSDMTKPPPVEIIAKQHRVAEPHSSLGYKTSAAYADHLPAPKGVSTVEAPIATGGKFSGRRRRKSRMVNRSHTVGIMCSVEFFRKYPCCFGAELNPKRGIAHGSCQRF